MTAPNPGDQASFAFGGTVRNDATLGLVVDWTTIGGQSGSAQLAQLPPPTSVTPTAYQRDAMLTIPGTGEPTTTQVPNGSVLKRTAPAGLAFRTPNGWRVADAQGDRLTEWFGASIAGTWKLIWVGP